MCMYRDLYTAYKITNVYILAVNEKAIILALTTLPVVPRSCLQPSPRWKKQSQKKTSCRLQQAVVERVTVALMEKGGGGGEAALVMCCDSDSA